MIVPEPMTPEPTESISKADIDRFCEIVKQVSMEAYTNLWICPIGQVRKRV